MDSVNKTLYIPLYGKASVSGRGIILRDPDAERIWEREGFELRGKAASKWLTYYMGMRAAVFDEWVKERLAGSPGACVLHIGCGLDSRAERVGESCKSWYDVDFPAVITERKKYFSETAAYHMAGSDARDTGWLEEIPEADEAIVVMEGFGMYLEPEELTALLAAISGRFPSVSLLIDCYTRFAARASKYKNPINEVGVTQLYGIDDPRELENGSGLRFTGEHELTPKWLVDQLKGAERIFFKVMFAGGAAKKIYRLFEYQTALD